MSSDLYAIEIDNVSKCYQVYDNPIKRLKEFIVPKVHHRTGKVTRLYHDEFWALQDISFRLKKGETVGIVGKNGSGKSTLLQIIAGTLTPTSEEKLHDIISFADIGHFIDSPVRAYSSGMLVRLAFAIQAQIEPEILIVDEALAVGDARFQAKCFARLKQLKENGTSILFVSHATEQIVTHCDSAILINDGVMLMQDSPRVVVNKYLDLLFGKTNEKEAVADEIEANIEPQRIEEKQQDLLNVQNWLRDGLSFEQRPNYNPSEYRWGDLKAEILDYQLVQDDKQYPLVIEGERAIHLQFYVRFKEAVYRPIFGFALKTKEGVTIYNTNSEFQNIDMSRQFNAGDIMHASLSMPVNLASGDYFISVGIASCDECGSVVPHDRRYDSIHLSVLNRIQFIGLVNLNTHFSLQ